METLHTVLGLLAGAAILLFELAGVTVIAAAGVRGVAGFVRRDPATRLRLARGMALGLEFKLGSEILRTVVVRRNHPAARGAHAAAPLGDQKRGTGRRRQTGGVRSMGGCPPLLGKYRKTRNICYIILIKYN